MGRRNSHHDSNANNINNSSSFNIKISTKNLEQQDMLSMISRNDITFIKGAPGSGKTYIAVACALQSLFKGSVKHLVFTRPVVEAGGEKLGFLPGNMYDKIDPYMIPIFDTLSKLLPPAIINKIVPKNNGNGNSNGNSNGNGNTDYPVRILPLAYMRGITFENSFVICDEMQNATPEQLRMVLTRLGNGSKMVICGDVYQTDIHKSNGLLDAFDLLQNIKGVGFVTLTQEAIMRHPVIKEIETRYLNRKIKNS